MVYSKWRGACSEINMKILQVNEGQRKISKPFLKALWVIMKCLRITKYFIILMINFKIASFDGIRGS